MNVEKFLHNRTRTSKNVVSVSANNVYCMCVGYKISVYSTYNQIVCLNSSEHFILLPIAKMVSITVCGYNSCQATLSMVFKCRQKHQFSICAGMQKPQDS